MEKNNELELQHGITLSNLIEAIERYERSLHSEKELGPAPKPPVKPDYVERWEEWEEYDRKQKNFQNAKAEFERKKMLAETSRQEARNTISIALPKNTWFRFTTSHGERWVGIETSSWHGSENSLHISETRPERILRHQSNFN